MVWISTFGEGLSGQHRPEGHNALHQSPHQSPRVQYCGRDNEKFEKKSMKHTLQKFYRLSPPVVLQKLRDLKTITVSFLLDHIRKPKGQKWRGGHKKVDEINDSPEPISTTSSIPRVFGSWVTVAIAAVTSSMMSGRIKHSDYPSWVFVHQCNVTAYRCKPDL